MMDRMTAHHWQLTPKEAISLQKELALQVVIKKLTTPVRYIAGLDCAFSTDKNYCIAAAILWDNSTNQVLEQTYAIEKLHFPYIPGLLSFREIPAMLAAFQKLNQQPDVVMVDGHGLAHPRRLGIASHLGVLTNLVTIGCAKSRLVGNYEEPEKYPNAKSNLIHKDEIIGILLRTKNNVKPVFVSVGNNLTLEQAEKIVMSSCRGYRLPEPTRLADKFVTQVKKTITQDLAK